MKKAAKRILIGLTATALILAVLPVALPPFVTRLAEAKLAALGFPARIRLRLGYAWNKGPELGGRLTLQLLDSPLRADASFGAGFGTWRARLQVPKTTLDESLAPVRRTLETRLPPGISNVTFRADVALEASVERTRRKPVPVWSAKLPLRNVTARLVDDDRPLSVDGLSVTLGASGLSDHLDIAPMFLRVSAAEAGGFALTNLTASFRATEKALLVSEARAEFCGGTVSLYSLFLDPKTLNAGFTLFLENVEAGKVLRHFNGFHGTASGRLHGKMRLFLKEGGRRLRFSDAFLYSTPGETGKLRMTDAGVITDNLALAGLDDATCQNVSNALADVDYTVLKLDLKRNGNTSAVLGIRLSGTATRGALSVPVDLNLNFNGDLEQIVNAGLGLSERLKGKQK